MTSACITSRVQRLVPGSHSLKAVEVLTPDTYQNFVVVMQVCVLVIMYVLAFLVSGAFTKIWYRSKSILSFKFERISAIECPTLAYWEGKVVSTTDKSPGTEVHVTCADDYKFDAADAATHYVVTCSNNGRWTPNIPQCTRKLVRMRVNGSL